MARSSKKAKSKQVYKKMEIYTSVCEKCKLVDGLDESAEVLLVVGRVDQVLEGVELGWVNLAVPFQLVLSLLDHGPALEIYVQVYVVTINLKCMLCARTYVYCVENMKINYLNIKRIQLARKSIHDRRCGLWSTFSAHV